VRRDFHVSRSYRAAFVLDLFFGFVSLAIYYFISKTFTVTPSNLAGAPSYFSFAAVGVALGLVVQAATFRVAQRLREEQLTGALETLVAQPVSAPELALGLAGFHFAFATVRAVAYLLIADVAFSADFSNADWLGFVVMMVVTAMAMAPVGIAVGAAVLVLKRAELLATVTTLALALVGGAYFPIDVLPGWLQPLAKILPTTFAFNGVRAALYRGTGWTTPALELLAVFVIAMPVALWLFASAIAIARRRGSLSTP
jgi:ABC-2 type transport system permease protein